MKWIFYIKIVTFICRKIANFTLQIIVSYLESWMIAKQKSSIFKCENGG